MNESTYQFILATSGSLILLLLAVIGFFLRQQVTATKSLNDSVNLLKTSIELLKQAHTMFSTTDKDKHDIIDRRLDAHSQKIEDHEKRLLKLEP